MSHAEDLALSVDVAEGPILTFDDYWAWDRCPTAALAGTKFTRPSGERILGRRLCREWPNKTKTLRTLVVDTYKASKWLAGTIFGQKRTQTEAPRMPPAKKGYWTSTGGVAEIRGGFVQVELDWCYPMGAGWEVILVDTHLTPPTAARSHGLLDEAAWTAAIFRLITGEHCSVRLIAPSYETEHLLETPASDLDIFLETSFQAQRQLRRVRPGLHCHELASADELGLAGYSKKQVWRCPLRRAGRCDLYMHSPNKVALTRD